MEQTNYEGKKKNKSLKHILCQWSQSLGSNLHRPKFACSTTKAKPCVQTGLLPVPRRHTMLVCGIYFIKSRHQDKNTQVDGAQQLQICDKTVQPHWSCATAHSTNAHLGTYPVSSVWVTACLLLQCAWEKETEQRHMRRVVKYRVWWVVIRSQSALWGVKHGSGHWHCRSSFPQRKATQRKHKEHKNSYTRLNNKDSTKAGFQALLAWCTRNQTTLSCHNFTGKKPQCCSNANTLQTSKQL